MNFFRVILSPLASGPENYITNEDVRITSGTSLALIYSDEAGLNPIAQPGAKTDDKGVFEFYGIETSYTATHTATGQFIELDYSDTGVELTPKYIIDDAPTTGGPYVRFNGAWAEL